MLCVSFGQVYELEGVVQLRDAHFWTLCSGNYHGSLRLDMMQGSDIRRSLELAKRILTEVRVYTVYIYMYIYTCRECRVSVAVSPLSSLDEEPPVCPIHFL